MQWERICNGKNTRELQYYKNISFNGLESLFCTKWFFRNKSLISLENTKRAIDADLEFLALIQL